MQAHIDPQPIPFSNTENTEDNQTNIIKFKMRHNPASDMSKTYKLKMNIFNKCQLEELLALFKNFKKEIRGTGTTTIKGGVNNLHIILRVESLK